MTTLRHTVRTLRRSWRLAHPGPQGAGPAPDGAPDPHAEAGMATAEYAIGTLAAAAFAGLLLAIIRSGSLSGVLQRLLESALSRRGADAGPGAGPSASRPVRPGAGRSGPPPA